MDYLPKKYSLNRLDLPIVRFHSDLKYYLKQVLMLQDYLAKSDHTVLNVQFCYYATVIPEKLVTVITNIEKHIFQCMYTLTLFYKKQSYYMYGINYLQILQKGHINDMSYTIFR